MAALWLPVLLLGCILAGAQPAAPADAGPTWAPPQCTLSRHAVEQPSKATEIIVDAAAGAASVWFADVGEKVFQHDDAPDVSCGAGLRLSAARGEHATMQIAVRSLVTLKGVEMKLASSTGGDFGPLVVQREAFTLVTTPASNVTSRGVGMYPDPLPLPNDTVRFPEGGDMVTPGETAVFWLTLGPIPANTKAGQHTLHLSVGSAARHTFPVAIQVWDFTLPDAAHASQWTETDPFGYMAGCNIIDTIRPKSCYTGSSCTANQSSPDCWRPPPGPGVKPPTTKPCLQSSVVDDAYQNLFKHRHNRVAWMESWGFDSGVGLTIADDTRSMKLDTAAFDRKFETLVGMGYRDLKLPIPGCYSAGSCSIDLNPNATFTFVNSSVASFDSDTGRAWWGTCEPAEPWRPPGWDGGVAYPHSQGIPCASQPPLRVPVWENKSLNAPSNKNASIPTWKDQDVGDPVEFNPEFLRLFHLMMDPLVKHLRAKGWINRTFAFVDDETPWPCYNNGVNFTVNSWVKVAKLFKSLDPTIRIQQDLSPASDKGPTWKAVEPLVDAWLLQGGQITGFSQHWDNPDERVASALKLIATARKDGKQVYMYNNELSIIDLSNHRTRTFPWSLWRTNYAYPISRHAGLQGSLSYYSILGTFGSDPWKNANALCGSPMGGPAHPEPRTTQCPPQCGPPGKPPPPPPPTPPNKCLAERAAGEWFVWYPPGGSPSSFNGTSQVDMCHSPAVTSIRWELFRQGLEDVEYLAMLDRLAGLADQKHSCGYEAAVLRGSQARVGGTAVAPLSACCTSLDGAKAALDAVSEVVWSIAPNWSIAGMAAEPGGENATLEEPYTMDAAVLHRVLDAVARGIESVRQHC